MQPSEADLIARASRGEHAAFTLLIEQYIGYLFAVAYSLTGSAADAEDVVQETLTGAYRGLHRFGQRTPIKVWLCGIAVRQAARHRKRRTARPAESLGMAMAKSQDDQGPPDAALTVAAATAAVDRRLDMESYLSRLSLPHRQVIVLREMHGLSYGEIAEALGVPVGTVESRLFRARAELAEMLKNYV